MTERMTSRSTANQRRWVQVLLLFAIVLAAACDDEDDDDVADYTTSETITVSVV